MCFRPMRIKLRRLPGSTEFDPRATYGSFVPCGKCEECRRSKAMSWSWRLNAEFEVLRERKDCEWHFAFCTLTYGTPKGGYDCDKVPTLPKSVFFGKYRRVECFDKSHVQEWIKDLRKSFHKKFWIGRKSPLKKVPRDKALFKYFSDTQLRYIACAEHGGKKGRPHYHVILAYPMINGITDEFVYNSCREFWAPKHGFLFPKYLNGDDREKPFVIQVGQLSKALSYVAKYVCKDMAFASKVQQANVDIHSRDFRRYDSFHLQSRSIGLSILKNLDDNSKLKLLIDGKFFVHLPQKGYQPVPAYIRDKIIFDNQYIYEPCKVPVKFDNYYDEDGNFHRHYIGVQDGYKRLVRKEASEFFKAHYKEVYSKQSRFYTRLFKEMLKAQFWSDRIADKALSSQLCKTCTNLSSLVGLSSIVDWYLGFYKRLPGILVNVPSDRAFLSRYDVGTYNSLCDLQPLDNRYVQYMNDVTNCFLSTLRFVWKRKSVQEEDFEERSHQIKESALHEI